MRDIDRRLFDATTPDAALALIELGADVDSIDDIGDMAIHVAALHGRIDMVRFWLGRGVDVDAPLTTMGLVHFVIKRLLYEYAWKSPDHDNYIRILECLSLATQDPEAAQVARQAYDAGRHVSRQALEKFLQRQHDGTNDGDYSDDGSDTNTDIEDAIYDELLVDPIYARLRTDLLYALAPSPRPLFGGVPAEYFRRYTLPVYTEHLRLSHPGSTPYVFLFRGIGYFADRWHGTSRRAHRQESGVQELYSEAVLQYHSHRGAHFLHSYDAFSKITGLGSRGHSQELTKTARLLTTNLVALRGSHPVIDGHNSGVRIFANFLAQIQHLYSNGIERFELFMKLLSEDSRIPRGLFLPGNPFVSTGELPRHALRYAIGLKPPYNKYVTSSYNIGGRFLKPYIGKLYVTKHPVIDFEHWNKPHIVREMSRLRSITPSREIGPELEVSFLGRIPKDRVIYSQKIRLPNFHRPQFPRHYLRKYGIDARMYELIRNIYRGPPSLLREQATQYICDYLEMYHSIYLMRWLINEATRNNWKLVFLSDDGVSTTSEAIPMWNAARNGLHGKGQDETLIPSSIVKGILPIFGTAPQAVYATKMEIFETNMRCLTLDRRLTLDRYRANDFGRGTVPKAKSVSKLKYSQFGIRPYIHEHPWSPECVLLDMFCGSSSTQTVPTPLADQYRDRELMADDQLLALIQQYWLVHNPMGQHPQIVSLLNQEAAPVGSSYITMQQMVAQIQSGGAGNQFFILHHNGHYVALVAITDDRGTALHAIDSLEQDTVRVRIALQEALSRTALRSVQVSYQNLNIQIQVGINTCPYIAVAALIYMQQNIETITSSNAVNAELASPAISAAAQAILDQAENTPTSGVDIGIGASAPGLGGVGAAVVGAGGGGAAAAAVGAGGGGAAAAAVGAGDSAGNADSDEANKVAPSGTSLIKQSAGIWNRYYIDGFDKLLSLRLLGMGMTQSKVKVLDEATPTQIEMLLPEKLSVDITTLVPIVYKALNKPAHWVGLIIKKVDGVDAAYKLTYIDPENILSPALLHESLLCAVKKGASIDFEQRFVSEQSYSDNCGPELIEHFAEAITGHRVAEHSVAAYHSELLERSLYHEAGYMIREVPLIADRNMLSQASEFTGALVIADSVADPEEFYDDPDFATPTLWQIQSSLYRASLALKGADTAIDAIRCYQQPTPEHAQALAVDALHLYAMWAGYSVVSAATSAVLVAHTYNEAGFDAAAKQAAMAAAYMALPVLAFSVSPAAGIGFVAAMTCYTAYQVGANGYMLYQENFGAEHFGSDAMLDEQLFIAGGVADGADGQCEWVA